MGSARVPGRNQCPVVIGRWRQGESTRATGTTRSALMDTPCGRIPDYRAVLPPFRGNEARITGDGDRAEVEAEARLGPHMPR